MPNEDFVSKALAGAKSALASANKFTASTGDKNPGMFSPKKAAPAPAPAKSAPSPSREGLKGEAFDAGAGIRERLKSQAEGKAAEGSFKKGGTVPKTGVYKLHKDEQVLPASKMDKSVLDKATAALGTSQKPKHGMRSTSIDHHGDGSHTVRHMPIEGGQDQSYAVKNTSELGKRIKEILGMGDDEEAEKKAPEPAAKEAAEGEKV